MFKFVCTIVLLMHLCHVLTHAAPKPTKQLQTLLKKSIKETKGPGSASSEAVCEEMKKKLTEKKKQKKRTEAKKMNGDSSRVTVVPENSRQLDLIARLVCGLKRTQCNALYLTCIQSGLGCNQCWDICQDLRECAVALGRDFASWAQEGEGNRFECQQECGCMFDIDL